MPSLPTGLQVSAKLVGSSMTGTTASVLWLSSQIGSVVFIVLMESVKTMLGSFQNSIVVLVVLGLVAAGLCSRITETGKETTNCNTSVTFGRPRTLSSRYASWFFGLQVQNVEGYGGLHYRFCATW